MSVLMPTPLLTDALRAELLAAAEGAYPEEACGLVVTAASGLRYWPCRNLAPESRDRFVIDPDDWVAAEEVGDVLAVFHSHPDATAHPSLTDRIACFKSGLSWLIAAWPGGALCELQPQACSAPLVGREFEFGVQDCYTLIQDYFHRELGIVLPDYDRDDGFWEPRRLADGSWQPGRELYLEGFESAGFVAIDGEPQQHDVILMQVSADVSNHGAVYLGDGRILHHLYGRLSTRDVYGGYWLRHTTRLLRHVRLMRVGA